MRDLIVDGNDGVRRSAIQGDNKDLGVAHVQVLVKDRKAFVLLW